MNDQPENDILWKYMDRLRWRLRKLPEQQSAEMLREIRQHLETLVADFVAAGSTQDEAARLTEEKFGRVEDVSRRLIQEYRGRRTKKFFSLDIPRMALFYCLLQAAPSGHNPIFRLREAAYAALIGIGFGLVAIFDRDAQRQDGVGALALICGGFLWLASAGFFVSLGIAFDTTLGMPQRTAEHHALTRVGFFAILLVFNRITQAFSPRTRYTWHLWP